MWGMNLMNVLKLSVDFIGQSINATYYQEVGWFCNKKLDPSPARESVNF